jgi:hypothetical protein
VGRGHGLRTKKYIFTNFLIMVLLREENLKTNLYNFYEKTKKTKGLIRKWLKIKMF